MHSAARVEGEELDLLRDDLTRVHEEVSRCFEISRRYLSFLNAQRVESTFVSVDQMLADLRDLLVRHPTAKNHQLAIHQLVPNAIAEINGTDFLQILLNLTINAFQSTDRPHRVEVEARHVPEPIALEGIAESTEQRFVNRDGFRNEPPMVAISVRDDGPGISPDIVPKMFRERFTTKPIDQGTGLGLSIVRRLVEEAGAGLHLRTKPGAGSTFTLLVKVRKDEA
jgi:signal transduction histidine kinase